MKINLVNNFCDTLDLSILIKLFSKIKSKKTFSIIIVSIDEIKRLNKDFRDINNPTDVLSFPSDIIKNDLGDVFICYEKVLIQSNEYGHSKERELCFLAVHGYLHLLGYDHIEKKDSIKMFKTTEKILKYVNLNKE